MHLRTHNTHQEIHTPSRVHGTCKCIIFYVCIVCAVNKKCTCAHTIHTKKYIRPRTLGYTGIKHGIKHGTLFFVGYETYLQQREIGKT